MKKTFLLICLAAGLLSCAKELTPQEEAPAGVPMTFEINVSGTKASKTDWEQGDDIILFFKGIEDNFILFSYNEETQGWDVGISNDTYTSSDFENLEEYILTAVYLPGISSLNIEDGYFDFFGIDEEHIFNFYLAKTGVPYTVDGTTVKVSFTMEKPEGFVQFHVAGIEDAVGKYTLASPQVRPVALVGVNFDGTLREEELQAGARLSGFADEDGAIFAGRLVDPDATAYTFTLASDDKIYSLERSSGLTAGKMYNFPALSDSRWTETAASDLYVDLGLTSGLKWAKYNLGAANETDYGDYFAWGETLGYNSGKTEFSWTNYFDTKDSGSTFEKYAVDTKTKLELVDDAAYAAWGGKFRMPTIADWKELVDECDWTWTDNYNETGIAGRICEGPMNTIFFPAGGSRYAYNISDVGYFGCYWSSTLQNSYSSEAMRMYFNSSDVKTFSRSRYYGYSIRPVCK